MAEISEQSKKAIQEFLAEWWADLTWKAHETVAGAQLPPQTPEQLYDQLFGATLRQIAAAAEGLLPDDDEVRAEVYEACQQVCEWMWARPGMPAQYYIPDGHNPAGANWWHTPIGWLVMSALAWCRGDEFISPSQAAKLAGVSPSAVSQWLKRGQLQMYLDPHEPNPQRATRLLRSDVERLRMK